MEYMYLPPSTPLPVLLPAPRQIMLGVSRGLQAMHDAGYTHRDVKPHNVLLRQGRPIIMDLGRFVRACVCAYVCVYMCM